MSTDIAQQNNGQQSGQPGNAIAQMNAQMPDWLREKEVKGKDQLGFYLVPPRLKIVQPQSSPELRRAWGDGSVLMMPQQLLLMQRPDNTDEGMPALAVTPIFFYTEYVTWNPIQMRGMLPSVRERTYDHKSDIARKSRDEKTRKEPCPESAQHSIMHCEHLNYAFILHVEGLERTPVLYSFARSEHFKGRTFCSLVQMRNASPFACNFLAVLADRRNQQGNWYGLDFTNPPQETGIAPWVTQEQYDMYETFHNEMMEAYNNQTLRAEYDDETAAPPDSHIENGTPANNIAF